MSYEDQFEVTFDEHPARQRIQGKTKVVEIPMFPKQRLIRLNGVGAGYLSLESGGVSMTQRFPEMVRLIVEKACAKELARLEVSKPVILSQPPELQVNETDE